MPLHKEGDPDYEPGIHPASDDAIQRVKETVDKHMTPAQTNPLLITEWPTNIPHSQRVHYERAELTYAELQKSANCSHDRIRRLTDTNNQLVRKVIDLQTKLDAANLKIWIMALIVSPAITMLVKALWSAITHVQ